MTDKHQLALPAPMRLTSEQISTLHQASLEIMTKTGLRFSDEEAISLFKKAGAKVSDGDLVFIEPKLVEWALDCAPKNIKIYDRNGQEAMQLGQGRCYYGVGSDCAYLYDLKSGERRRAKKQDVRDGIRLVDALDNIDFAMSMVLPEDVPVGKHEPFQMATMLAETTKPIVFVGENLQSSIFATEMATTVVGSEKTLAEAPFIINYVNTISAFKHNKESVKRLLYAAGKNLPTIYSPCQTRGTVSPITSAGAIALGNAGHMGGLVLSQLKREGSPFIQSNLGGQAMDLRTMLDLYLSPDDGFMGWDLTRSNGLPIFGTAGCSESKIFDGQAASEAALSLFNHTINGANLIHDLGYLDCAMTYSYEMLMLCDEIVGWLKRYLKPPVINDETLALDVIHELGPDNNFLSAKHTFNHVREDWQPALFDHNHFHKWDQQGRITFEQRAKIKIADIIESHRCTRLPDEISKTIEGIKNKYSH
jgi:trimethylamine---corrinoid protein Co-methyltransferase